MSQASRVNLDTQKLEASHTMRDTQYPSASHRTSVTHMCGAEPDPHGHPIPLGRTCPSSATHEWTPKRSRRLKGTRDLEFTRMTTHVS